MITLPTAAGATTEYEDFYETTLAAPVGASDTDIYPTTMPASAVGFLVIDPLGTNPEIIFYNVKGANYVRVPSNTDGQGRGVGTTTPRAFDSGTKIGMYSIAEFYEGIVTGALMRDGFLQTRHFSSAIDPNSWIGTGETWNYVGHNGQREYQYVVAGDKRTKYTKGMKVRMPRVATVPTQDALFVAASSHNATRASVANLTFTDDFSVIVELQVNSLNGGDSVVFSRTDGTSGWWVGINAAGQVVLNGFNGAFSNFRRVVSVNSVPLGRKFTIAATLDMSGFTAATNKVWIDGDSKPVTLIQSGTNPAAMVNTGTEFMGSLNNVAGTYFNGEISMFGIFSAALSDATVKSYQAKVLTGAEANCVGLYTLNGNFNDSTGNANHLTANNGVTVTNTSTFFNAVEYGIITDISFSAGNSTITVWTGQSNNAPQENLTGIGYSGARTPVGFPASRMNWSVDVIFKGNTAQASPTTNQWYNVGAMQLSIPIGEWSAKYEVAYEVQKANSFADVISTLSNANNTELDPIWTMWHGIGNTSTSFDSVLPCTKENGLSVTTQSIYYVNAKQTATAINSITLRGDNGACVLRAISAYV